jgi:hypothetical protein
MDLSGKTWDIFCRLNRSSGAAATTRPFSISAAEEIQTSGEIPKIFIPTADKMTTDSA